MKVKKIKRRTINIPKEDFDKIKKYCDDNALRMPKWMVKIVLEKINKGV